MQEALVQAEEEWQDCLVQPSPFPPDLAASFRRARFKPLPGFDRLSSLPWMLKATVEQNHLPVKHIDGRLDQLIFLVVSQEKACRFCYGATRAMLRIQGLSDRAIDRLEHDLELREHSDAELAALGYARLIARSDPRPTQADRDRLKAAGYSANAIAEITLIAVISTMRNSQATLLALPIERRLEGVARNPFLRLIAKPVVAAMERARIPDFGRVPPGVPVPCEELLRPFEAVPAAGLLKRHLYDFFTSTVLPLRTKAFITLVIARAVGCEESEAAIRKVLQAEGVPDSVTRSVADHLDAPELDTRERLLVPFARETVRYRSGAIQARFREVTAGFTTAEILETLGAVMLANAMSRLTLAMAASRC